MKKLLVLPFLISFAHAQNITTEDLLQKSRRSTDLIRAEGENLSQEEKNEVSRLYDKIRSVILGSDTSDPTEGDFAITAVCHIDDDPDFTEGQNIVGKIRGKRVGELVEDCQALARNAYGTNGSSGLVDIKIEGEVPARFQTAVCEIDDDADFTPGQKTVGKIAGESLSDLIDDCESVAKTAYTNGSSGLSQVNAGRTAPANYTSAECHVDDDADFTPGQLVIGRIWGLRVSDLAASCAKAAQVMYHGNGSSGLQNIQ